MLEKKNIRRIDRGRKKKRTRVDVRADFVAM